MNDELLRTKFRKRLIYKKGLRVTFGIRMGWQIDSYNYVPSTSAGVDRAGAPLAYRRAAEGPTAALWICSTASRLSFFGLTHTLPSTQPLRYRWWRENRASVGGSTITFTLFMQTSRSSEHVAEDNWRV